MFDSLNVPAFYIINYPNNGGFTMISATKKYLPILAYSETGYFDTNNMNEGVEMIVDSYKYTIQNLSKLNSDSLRTKYAIDWDIFESKSLENVETETRASISDKKSAEIAKWSALGYECHNLGAASSFMDYDRYRGFTRDICARTDPRYDCLSSNLLLIKRSNEGIQPLLATNWSQSAPFNINAPNSYAGCVPIAIAQIMRYHQWPTSYNWNLISIYPSANSETYRFIKDVRKAADVEYKKDGTSSNYNKATKAFKSMGYTPSLKDYDGFRDRSTVISELKAGRPVYMSGSKNAKDWIITTEYKDGHAWFCDGYNTNIVQYAAAMLTNSNDGDMPNVNGPEPNYYFFSGMTDNVPYFHMNWGWGASYNGWYHFNTATATTSDNYQYNRKMILTKPNR